MLLESCVQGTEGTPGTGSQGTSGTSLVMWQTTYTDIQQPDMMLYDTSIRGKTVDALTHHPYSTSSGPTACLLSTVFYRQLDELIES